MLDNISSLVPKLAASGGVFALGNFDGAHRGHRVVIDAAVARARALGVPARVLTFEPHPRSVFWADHVPFRLTPPNIKEQLLKARGIDDVVVLPFTLNLAQVSAPDFVEHILRRRLGAQHVIAGYDFTFGYKRGGDMALLAALLTPHGIGVSEIAAQGDGEAFSSTRIRELLSQGDIEAANAMLGRDWSIAGTIIKGAQRGRTIGVPTANIFLGDYLRPKFGVYAVRANRAGQDGINKGGTYKGVANIGTRPTVDGARENLEAHLFDFNQDIYGQGWEFALTHFIRPEHKFETMDELKTQITKDIAAAKNL